MSREGEVLGKGRGGGGGRSPHGSRASSDASVARRVRCHAAPTPRCRALSTHHGAQRAVSLASAGLPLSTRLGAFGQDSNGDNRCDGEVTNGRAPSSKTHLL